jgi:hypothetical protein
MDEDHWETFRMALTHWDGATEHLQTTLDSLRSEGTLTKDELRAQRSITHAARLGVSDAKAIVQAKIRRTQRANVTLDEAEAKLSEHPSKDFGDVKRLWQETLKEVR